MSSAKVDGWLIEKRLGQGSLGSVYLARNESTGQRAALKLLTEEPAQLQGVALRLEREMNTLQKLKHENLVRLLGAGEHEGQPYFLMEHVDGFSVAHLLEEQGTLPWPQVVEIAMQVCRGLHHAYLQDIVHRNLKPSNLLCTSDGIIKVSECGINRCFAETSFAPDGSLIGTADYLSPEQAAKKPPTRQSDLYSLGVICYQLLTGRLPFIAETDNQMLQQHRKGRIELPSKHVRNLPAELEQLVMELLDKDPDKRPASAALLESRFLAVRTKHRSPEDGPSLQASIARTRGGATKTKEVQETESENETIPWLRVVLLGVMLLLVVGALIWGLWPASPESVIAEVQTLVDQQSWNEAETRLNRHAGKLTESPFQEQAAALREKIKAGLALKQAQRQQGTFAFPSSEAERLFRRGVSEWYQGQPEKAKKTWEQVVAAFGGIPSQTAWVDQARKALEDARTNRPTYQELADALDKASKEKPEEARKRLESLKALYAGAEKNDPKLRDLLDKLDRQLAALPK